ncbi:MAG TPA: right-handed parallel beta-helix repeat-containing protein, partial [Burkholderiales bacterium]|nr:right-handed parallel beta-helix repeat-containing protein [Burkholderiales bacterium]
PTPTPTTSGLPSTGTKAIPTFESIGLYWSPGANPGSAGCTVRYRKASESTWKDGLAMWYDARNAECRGSLVHLASGTSYVVQLGLPGQSPSRELTTSTWNEQFPIARTVVVPSQSTTLNITQGGSPGAYVLYTAAAGGSTIDVANNADYNVNISAPYVILRGFTLKNARVNGVNVTAGTDVVIENNDISGWGRSSGVMSAGGYMIGTNMDSGIYARCSSSFTFERSVIQRNRIHDPRYGAQSWSEAHPSGPNAVFFSECGGNHVFRYNDIWGSYGHKYMDAYGGEENFGLKGMPNADSDLYGNRIQDTQDDAIESEGANRNVRIWGNYFNNTGTGVATTATSVGPIYIWRNVMNRSRNLELSSLDADSRLYMFKSGQDSTYGNGRRYVFHNTILQLTQAGAVYPLGAGEGLSGPSDGEPMANTVSRNNIFHIWKSWWNSADAHGGGSDDFDYDLYNGNLVGVGSEPHGIVGTPVYASGNGPTSESGGMYQLAPSSPGYDRGVRLPNFNDSFTGGAPDMGAHEAGTPAMKFGVQ